MIDIASIGVSTVIDQNYRRKVQLCLLGLLVTVSIATFTWFTFPASQNVLALFLLPAMFLLFTLSMGYYMFIFSCEEKSLVKNVLGMVEPAESVKSIEQGKILLNLKETILSSAITIFKYNLLRSIFAVITGRSMVLECPFGSMVLEERLNH